MAAQQVAPGRRLHEGEELVTKPFERLIAKQSLFAHNYAGFWAAMDSFKDKITLDRMESRGDCPWMVWKRPPGGSLNDVPR